MRAPTAVCVAALASVAAAHTSRLPGRFVKHGLQLPTAGCETAFTLEGVRYNLSSLQVDVGGYIAMNNVDNFSYCINLCKVVTSERNCVCYACGGQEYPAAKILNEGGSKGETCQAYLGTLSDTTWAPLGGGRKGLTLTYGGGQDGDAAVIDMPCDPTTTGINGPTFVGVKGTAYHFTWNTSLTCPP